jgi:hypothetical protein
MFSAWHLELGHCLTQSACLKRARNSLMHRSNSQLHPITSSVRRYNPARL